METRKVEFVKGAQLTAIPVKRPRTGACLVSRVCTYTISYIYFKYIFIVQFLVLNRMSDRLPGK